MDSILLLFQKMLVISDFETLVDEKIIPQTWLNRVKIT